MMAESAEVTLCIAYCHEKKFLIFKRLALERKKLEVEVCPVQSVIQFLDEKIPLTGDKASLDRCGY